MNPDDLRAECVKARSNAIANGLDPDDAHVLLIVRRRRPQRSRVMLWWPKGPLGKFVGDLEDNRVLADFKVANIERALARLP